MRPVVAATATTAGLARIMSMFDYWGWVQRALEFTTGLGALSGKIRFAAHADPPMKPPEVAALSARLRLPLPEPLCAFLTTASANCACTYWWEPPAALEPALEQLFHSNSFIFGGASLCDHARFYENQIGCYDLGTGWELEKPEAAKLWLNSVPFHDVGNGDCFGLYVGSDRRGRDYPVVYLDHDACSCVVLAPSFDEFLAAWEKLCYIGGFFLRDFLLDPISGSINPNSKKRELLRDLLRTAGFQS